MPVDPPVVVVGCEVIGDDVGLLVSISTIACSRCRGRNQWLVGGQPLQVLAGAVGDDQVHQNTTVQTHLQCGPVRRTPEASCCRISLEPFAAQKVSWRARVPVALERYAADRYPQRDGIAGPGSGAVHRRPSRTDSATSSISACDGGAGSLVGVSTTGTLAIAVRHKAFCRASYRGSADRRR